MNKRDGLAKRSSAGGLPDEENRDRDDRTSRSRNREASTHRRRSVRTGNATRNPSCRSTSVPSPIPTLAPVGSRHSTRCPERPTFVSDPQDSLYGPTESERTHRNEPPARFDASYRADGDPFHAQPGTLEHWLKARYCLYGVDRMPLRRRPKRRSVSGRDRSSPVDAGRGELDRKGQHVGDPFGFRFGDSPHLLFAQPIDVRVWTATQC